MKVARQPNPRLAQDTSQHVRPSSKAASQEDPFFLHTVTCNLAEQLASLSEKTPTFDMKGIGNGTEEYDSYKLARYRLWIAQTTGKAIRYGSSTRKALHKDILAASV